MRRGLARPILGPKVNFPICLAPMVGLSHVALRLVVRRYLPRGAKTLWPTEMLNSRKLPHEVLGSTPETLRRNDETGLVPQILGNEEVAITQSVAALADWGAEGIDINMGCPVSRALRHNYGVALMGDADYAAQVVRMTVRASKLPVSVKLRAGLQKDQDYLVRFVQGLEREGANWICLHPRPGRQGRRGQADWEQIRVVREEVSIPVIGNGDVQVAEDVEAMLTATGCDMVMVGRALTARPWLLWQWGESWGWPPPPGREGESAPRSGFEEGQEYGRSLLFLVEELEQSFTLAAGLKRLNFHLRNSHPWLEFGHALSASLSRAQTWEDARERLTLFFSTPQRMVQRTDLRY